MSLPDPLMFTVGLIDQITKPIAHISKQFNGLAANYQKGSMQMMSGVAGIAASGYALQNALMPAIEMDRSLGEVKSLGVAESALEQLSRTSYEYALKYGKSATEFVSSSYDIQSAIGGLSDTDLSQFTLASNVLATATKADAATITSYMGTMYGIFKNDAKTMGKSEWVEQVTGMTATAVEIFKTNGNDMSGAFTAIGAKANNAGIAMNEQMAILGTLQSTMSGSMAGSKYKSFLSGVGKAQAALGLEFTDSKGKMLPMIDILNEIKGKFGDTLDVDETGVLKKAFGSDEAMATIELLMNDVDGLAASMEQLGQVQGMGKAEEMAAAMTDQSERLSQSWFVIRAAFGSAILPAFNEFVGGVADMGKDVLWFTDTFPNLTKYIGYAAVGVLGLVAAGGLLTVMMGVGKMAMTAFGAASLVWSGITATLTAGLSALRGVMLAVNIAMYANPIGLIVAGVAAATIAVGALIYYWDDLKASIGEWGWVQGLFGAFNSAWTGIKTLFTESMNWIIDKLNLIPGVDIEFLPDVKSLTSVQEQLQGQAVEQQVLPAIFNETNAAHNQAALPAFLPPAANDAQITSNVIPMADYVFLPELAPELTPTTNMPLPVQDAALDSVNKLPLFYSEPTPMPEYEAANQLTGFAPHDVMESMTLPKPMNNDAISRMVMPKLDVVSAKRAQVARQAGEVGNKQLSFGDVIITNPPKNFSLAEIAEQQELQTG
ncbi:phage tail tape measure protein [Shewanella surugensis]|uniref:Phage tail tape measure protein n=1 Tax=Shewanella surugensis TaxID=212020 RepID=A0ABT0L769_9GAMM|nr:phage tail tape measure protein [Shewanella surugensis]MCL1123523.1 phage tail tape measure protein [Shewanella surugensis]